MESQRTGMLFSTPTKKATYFETHCCEMDGGGCWYARMMYRRYEDE